MVDPSAGCEEVGVLRILCDLDALPVRYRRDVAAVRELALHGRIGVAVIALHRPVLRPDNECQSPVRSGIGGATYSSLSAASASVRFPLSVSATARCFLPAGLCDGMSVSAPHTFRKHWNAPDGEQRIVVPLNRVEEEVHLSEHTGRVWVGGLASDGRVGGGRLLHTPLSRRVGHGDANAVERGNAWPIGLCSPRMEHGRGCSEGGSRCREGDRGGKEERDEHRGRDEQSEDREEHRGCRLDLARTPTCLRGRRSRGRTCGRGGRRLQEPVAFSALYVKSTNLSTR